MNKKESALFMMGGNESGKQENRKDFVVDQHPRGIPHTKDTTDHKVSKFPGFLIHPLLILFPDFLLC
jgi:hypothetical protein